VETTVVEESATVKSAGVKFTVRPPSKTAVKSTLKPAAVLSCACRHRLGESTGKE
jgi:hypothetical protein